MVGDLILVTFAVLSSEAVTSCLPSLEKLTERTAPAWPFRVTDSPLLYNAIRRM